MSFYNMIFTALAPLVVGIMDKDVDRTVCLRYPGLYVVGASNKYFTLPARAVWLLNGAFQAVVVFVMTMAATALISNRNDGSTASLWGVGATLYTVVVITVHLQLAIMVEQWTWMHMVAIWGSIGTR